MLARRVLSAHGAGRPHAAFAGTSSGFRKATSRSDGRIAGEAAGLSRKWVGRVAALQLRTHTPRAAATSASILSALRCASRQARGGACDERAHVQCVRWDGRSDAAPAGVAAMGGHDDGHGDAVDDDGGADRAQGAGRSHCGNVRRGLGWLRLPAPSGGLPTSVSWSSGEGTKTLLSLAATTRTFTTKRTTCSRRLPVGLAPPAFRNSLSTRPRRCH